MIATADRPFPVYKRFRPGEDTPWGVMHVFNRVAGGQFLLGPEEKDRFRSLLFRCADFCGLEILTWTCLDNHFHVLLSVPSDAEAIRLRAVVSEEDIFARMERCFSRQYIKEVRWRLEKFRSTPGQEALADTILRRLRAQMYDISAYMHMVQRRFSSWCNQKHGRKGTLWQGRFGSTLIEPSEEALLRTAAYIDLNPVRAGLTRDPKNYRWCGYAEALAGKADARRGIAELVALAGRADPVAAEEADALGAYRDRLAEVVRPLREESGEILRAKAEAGNARSRSFNGANLLLNRVRYFSASLAIGSREFVESVYQRYRDCFSERRQSGARTLRHGDWSGLCGLRDLRKEVVEPPQANIRRD